MSIIRYEDLDAWQRGFETAIAVYQWTQRFPVEERFGLTMQIRRAAASIPANIAEGFARRKPKDKARLYNIAEGSAEEVSVFVRLGTALGFGVRSENLEKLVKSAAMLARCLTDSTLARAASPRVAPPAPSPREGREGGRSSRDSGSGMRATD